MGEGDVHMRLLDLKWYSSRPSIDFRSNWWCATVLVKIISQIKVFRPLGIGSGFLGLRLESLKFWVLARQWVGMKIRHRPTIL